MRHVMAQASRPPGAPSMQPLPAFCSLLLEQATQQPSPGAEPGGQLHASRHLDFAPAVAGAHGKPALRLDAPRRQPAVDVGEGRRRLLLLAGLYHQVAILYPHVLFAAGVELLRGRGRGWGRGGCGGAVQAGVGRSVQPSLLMMNKQEALRVRRGQRAEQEA